LSTIRTEFIFYHVSAIKAGFVVSDFTFRHKKKTV
jgi:hypothetical protein